LSRRVVWSKTAESDLKSLDKKTAERVVKAVNKLAATDQGDVKKLKGEAGILRLRVGKWRVFFKSEPELLTIFQIETRENAYR
jgi:mRNA interferase RelE/StbE